MQSLPSRSPDQRIPVAAHPLHKASSYLLIFCAALLSIQRENQAFGNAPNIVLLLIDDMGWPDPSCYGHRFHETPCIDSLAQEGVRFTDFYAATPVCSSTRATIQTGQYSARVGITDFIPGHWRPFEKLVVPPIKSELPRDLTTVGAALQAAGYATGYFGKWHLGGAPDEYGYETTDRQLGDTFRQWRGEQGREAAGPKRIDLLTDQTLYFIEQDRERPFFVTLSHHAVHIKLESRDETFSKYREKPKPSTGLNNPRYAAMIEDLDTSVGRIRERLKELELVENTVIVFTSDNGGLRKTFSGLGEEVSTNAPLRDEKGSLYEGGIRVPLVVRWPGVVPAGTTCAEPATTADLLPTFCRIAAWELPAQPIDGLDLSLILRDPIAKLGREAIYFHYPHYHHSRPAGAIRAGNWKLIEFFDDGALELYNLTDDMSEARNLAQEQPEHAARLQRQLAAWRNSVGARMPTENPDYDQARASEWRPRTAKRLPKSRQKK